MYNNSFIMDIFQKLDSYTLFTFLLPLAVLLLIIVRVKYSIGGTSAKNNNYELRDHLIFLESLKKLYTQLDSTLNKLNTLHEYCNIYYKINKINNITGSGYNNDNNNYNNDNNNYNNDNNINDNIDNNTTSNNYTPCTIEQCYNIEDAAKSIFSNAIGNQQNPRNISDCLLKKKKLENFLDNSQTSFTTYYLLGKFFLFKKDEKEFREWLKKYPGCTLDFHERGECYDLVFDWAASFL